MDKGFSVATLRGQAGTGTAARAGPRRRIPRALRSPLAFAGLVVLALVVLAAVLGPWIAPHDPAKQDLRHRLSPPAFVAGGSTAHLLGTDQLGRDVLSRLLFGAQVSLVIAVAAVCFSLIVGAALGLLAGYYGGVPDRVIMRLADIQLAFPFILLVVSLVAILGPSMRSVILALSISGWVVYSRVTRAQVLVTRQKEFVDAARCLGGSDGRILVRHVLPEAIPSLIVVASFSIAQLIIVESALDFLGLGVQPPRVTWGTMMADSLDYLQLAWWLAVAPGLALALTVLSINLVGDMLRDLTDPRATGRMGGNG